MPHFPNPAYMKDQRLNEIQRQLDENFTAYAKKEFDLHSKNYEQIKPLLEERDLAVVADPAFWSTALKNSEFGREEVDFDCSVVKSLFAGYEGDYWCLVEVVLNENPYTDKTILRKRFNVATEEVDFTKFDLKRKTGSMLLEFFKDDEVDLDLFDTLYNLYVNGVYYYYTKE